MSYCEVLNTATSFSETSVTLTVDTALRPVRHESLSTLLLELQMSYKFHLYESDR